jgi:triosephosphate isomerase
MNHTPREAAAWARAFGDRIAPYAARFKEHLELAVAPPSPALDRLGEPLKEIGVHLAAQNVHAEASGAFTGEVSAGMLEELGCRYVLIGHSERRQLFGEQDIEIAAKARRLQSSTLRPILCVGETLQERERNATLEVVERQLRTVLETADGLGATLVVAYEPVWAIGTGQTASPEVAQDVHSALRGLLIERLGEVGRDVRILYGGSVKPANAGALLSQADIDGALVGGASLDPESFATLALASLETS